MRRWVLAIALGLTSLTACSGQLGGSANDCAAPQISTEPFNSSSPAEPSESLAAHAGQKLTIYGWFWVEGCADGSPADTHVVKDVDLRLSGADGSSVDLGTAHPGGESTDYGFAIDVTIPAETTPGPATITTRSSYVPASLDLTVQ